MAFRRSARALVMIAGGLALLAPPALAASSTPALNGYPRLAFYGSIRGTGFPFYYAPLDTALDDTVLDKVARFEEIILDVSPIWPYKPNLLNELRARNPKAKLLGYVVGQDIWNAYDPDSLVHYPTRYRRLLDDNNGWLYDVNGSKYYAGDANLAKKDTSGRFVIADSLSLLWQDVGIRSGVWDGLFFDILCDNMAWSQTPGHVIDYARAGYSTYAEFDQSWHAATDTIATLLRSWAGPNFILVGNCALGTKYTTFNGWMREDFPHETGGTWYSNMYWVPGGYMTDEANFLPPRHDYIFSSQVGLDQYSASNARVMRFGLGSATLGDGFGVFGGSDRDAYHADYHNWWYDEYAVNLDTHQASTSHQDTGWLGQALGPLYQMIWTGSNPEGVANPDFETNTAGWQTFFNTPGAFRRDTTTAGAGRGSARIDIFQASPVDWKVNFNTPIGIDFIGYYTYSVTFWAKATSARTFNFVIGQPGAGPLVSQSVTIGTTWVQYQIPVTPYSSVSGLSLQFYLARDAGTVWFDGVHVQLGTSTVYRRDFQHGTVLVNPALYDYATVTMERPFHRILGTVDPLTNDGTTSNVQVVNPSDALFLIGDDVTPPSPVVDLHQVIPPH